MTEDEDRKITELFIAVVLALAIAFFAGAIIGWYKGGCSAMSDMRISIEDDGMVIAELYGNEWVHFAE